MDSPLSMTGEKGHTFLTLVILSSQILTVKSILSAKMLTNVMLVQALIMHVIPIQLVLTLMAPMIVSLISDRNPITTANSILFVSMNVIPMPASTMPVISTLPVLTMMDLLFVIVTSVGSQIMTVNMIPSLLTSTSVMLTLISHMLVTSILHAPTRIVPMFASVMTAGSQTPMVFSIQSASTLMNAKMELKRVISTQPEKIHLAHTFAFVFYLQLC